MGILLNPTSPQSIGNQKVNSTNSSVALQTSSTSGIKSYIDAPSIVIPPLISDWQVPGNVNGGGMKNKYIVLVKKKIYTINASSALSSLKKVCDLLQLKSGKINVQKMNHKRKTQIHRYKVSILKNGKRNIKKL